MSLKGVLSKIVRGAAYPFRALVGFILRPDVTALLVKAAKAAVQKTKLGALVNAVVAEVELIKAKDPNIDPHAAAVNLIIARATEASLFWKASLVNLLIELAVFLLKHTQEKLVIPEGGPAES